MKNNDLTIALFEQFAEPFTAEALFDQMPDIVFFIKNAEGCYVCVNHTLVRRSGKQSKSALVGRTPSQILGESLGKGYEAQDHKVLKSGQQLLDELELHVYQSREVGWCLTSKLPLLGRGGQVIGLVGISRDLKVPDVSSVNFGHIATAVEYAEARLANPPTLAQLAAVASMSIYQLDRRMKRLFGLSTGQWLLKTRIDHAGRQLHETDLAIVDIALNSGYTDQSAFTRQFRRTTGQTPSEFRHLRR
jgi:AraC-like DNA-binding protein